MNVAVLAVDPTRRRTGGALLGDRIRMNTLRRDNFYMRSMATRRQHLATSAMLGDAVAFLKSLSFDLVIVETAGIGQSDSEIVDLVDVPVYVMTSEFGAPSQLEKIDMLDFAEIVVLNKFDKRGADDALRDVRKQWRRNHANFDRPDGDIPVYPTIASQFNDPGMTWMFTNLCQAIAQKMEFDAAAWTPETDVSLKEPRATVLIPGRRTRYLAEIAEQGRGVNEGIERLCEAANRAQHCHAALGTIGDDALPAALEAYPAERLTEDGDRSLLTLRQRYNAALDDLGPEARQLLAEWPARLEGITREEYRYEVRGKAITGRNYVESLSHQQIPKIAPPRFDGWGDLLRFLMKENLPGAYPYTVACSRTGVPARTRRACSRARARPSGRTAAFITSITASLQRGCRRRSIP